MKQKYLKTELSDVVMMYMLPATCIKLVSHEEMYMYNCTYKGNVRENL